MKTAWCLPQILRLTLIGTFATASLGFAQTGTFQQVPGALAQISVGADGSVWGINQGQQIYTYNTDTSNWTNIPGSLAQIAVGNAHAVWGINYANQIYAYDAATGGWINVPGELNQIAVGADGDVWGINYQHYVFHYDASSQRFYGLDQTLASIVVGSASTVYGIDNTGQVYWYNPGLYSFSPLNGAAGYSQLAVGVDGDLWGLQNTVPVGHNVLINHWNVLRDRFEVAGAGDIPQVNQIALGFGGAVFAIDASGAVFQWNATGETWVQLPGNLSHISAGANGSAWGINSAQEIFQLVGQPTRPFQTLIGVGFGINQPAVGIGGTAWGAIPTPAVYFDRSTQSFQLAPASPGALYAPAFIHLSVGARSNVWGVDNIGTIYKYDPNSAAWDVIPGELRQQIAVAASGSVWGINSVGQTFTYNSATHGWTNIPGELVQLSVGADGAVWGVNASEQIYRFDSGTQSWVNVPGSLVQISVGNGTNVWGVNAEQHVYRYNFNLPGWDEIPNARLAQVSVGFDGTVWGVTLADSSGRGSAYRWDSASQSFLLVQAGVASVTVVDAATVWASYGDIGAVYTWL